MGFYCIFSKSTQLWKIIYIEKSCWTEGVSAWIAFPSQSCIHPLVRPFWIWVGYPMTNVQIFVMSVLMFMIRWGFCFTLFIYFKTSIIVIVKMYMGIIENPGFGNFRLLYLYISEYRSITIHIAKILWILHCQSILYAYNYIVYM